MTKKVKQIKEAAAAVASQICIAGKDFDWNAHYDPDYDSNNYFNGFVSGELSELDGRLSSGAIIETVKGVDSTGFLQSEGLEIAGALGTCLTDGKTLTRREAFLMFLSFKIAYGMREPVFVCGKDDE